MDIDFPLVLVVLTFVTGVIWLADKLVLKKRRQAASGSGDDAGQRSADESAEPWLVDISRSFFPVLAVVLVLRSFLVRRFRFPSVSLLPPWEVGALFLVNRMPTGLAFRLLVTK